VRLPCRVIGDDPTPTVSHLEMRSGSKFALKRQTVLDYNRV
jgi:hypothetical protein